MSTEKKKFSQDLAVLEAMAEEMETYLKSDVLFWQMMNGDMPKLTLGGYLMRQHRLLALRNLLPQSEQARLDAAVLQFNKALVEKVVRLEKKIHRELGARIRQWSEYLKDLDWQRATNVANYPTAVTTRVMIAALVDKLQTAPYQLDAKIPDQVSLLDGNLRRRWQPGALVWDEVWRPAYPKSEYWYLYGCPKQSGQ